MGDSQPRRLEERLAREIAHLLALTVVALVQVTWLTTPLGFALPLILVLVTCRTLIGISAAFPDAGLLRALSWALYGGLSLDLLATTPLGAHALALLVPVLVITASARRLRVDRPLFVLLAVLVASLIYELILAWVTQPGPIVWAEYLQVVILPVVLVALIMSLPVYVMLRWSLRDHR